jgi:diaminobutyrate-2-oxoglutarate transaminase
LLIDPALDQWDRAEHTGTFRGFTFSHLTGAKALRHFWTSPDFISALAANGNQLGAGLASLKGEFSGHVRETRQLGMLSGIKLLDASLAKDVQRNCFDLGLIIESVGPQRDTLKLLPPLTISSEDLAAGLSILRDALKQSIRNQ